MSKDLSGVTWTAWPLAGAVGAGRQDELPVPPEGFALTPSAFAEQEQEQAAVPAGPAEQEVPGEGPE